MNIIDCVVVNDELDLYRARVAYLSELGISTFCFAESKISWQGKQKQLYFIDVISALSSDFPTVKFRRYEIELDLSLSHQGREDQARHKFLSKLTDDFISDHLLFCDVDEFPSSQQLQNYQKLSSHKIYSIPLNLKYLRCDLQHIGVPLFFNSKIGPADLMKESKNIRMSECPTIDGEAGEHFSFCGFDGKAFRNKITSYGTSEYNRVPYRLPNFFNIALRYRIDPLGRPELRGQGLLELIYEDSYSSTMKAFKLRYPNWFTSDLEESPTKLDRLLVSNTIRLSHASESKILFLRLIKLVEKSNFVEKCLLLGYVLLRNILEKVNLKSRNFFSVIIKRALLVTFNSNRKGRAVLNELSYSRTAFEDFKRLLDSVPIHFEEVLTSEDFIHEVSPIEISLNKWGSDKCQIHSYGPIYSQLLLEMQNSKPLSILEIGIFNGASLRAFADCFPDARVVGLDIEADRLINEKNIESYEVDQLDGYSWDRLANDKFGEYVFDLIIDDGLHSFAASLESFRRLNSQLSDTAYFVVEDALESDLIKWKLFGLAHKEFTVRIINMKAIRPNIPDNNLVLIKHKLS